MAGTDIVRDYYGWCKYTAAWLKEQDVAPKWDKHSVAKVLKMPGNHPTRGVGRYTEDTVAGKPREFHLVDSPRFQGKFIREPREFHWEFVNFTQFNSRSWTK
ncbi:hypothetical protein R3P38DRAFT_2786386 [Favolaschia claudopus]|uniref:Uncharacterized protein n=1 Tax=Favolaschia claudopus TaxID=2862362 RepID=A0AAW0ATL7_9AGAR